MEDLAKASDLTFTSERKADCKCPFYSQVSWKGEFGYGKDQRRRKAA